jgi:hypothetical protein
MVVDPICIFFQIFSRDLHDRIIQYDRHIKSNI